jgi:hypothetical protein
MGAAGESYALNGAMFQQIVEVFAALTVRDGIDPQIGVISLSMQQTLDRIAYLFDDASHKLFDHLKRSMIDPGYDKTMVHLCDPGFSNRLLPPYLGLNEEETDACRKINERDLKHID